MTAALFGTDGIRGLANEEPMTAMTALKVALAAGCHFRNADRRHVAGIGKDTRLSGYMLEPALTAGLVSVGIDVVLVGPLPTPAIAMLTRSMRADVGIALDGDADRVIVVDERGVAVDGDQIMGLVASSWAGAGRLMGGGLVATVMSNLGLERFLDGLKLKLVRTKVGDRYVVEEMRRAGFNVGGEQSGHIILSDYTTTGDGLIAALQFLAVVIQSGKTASTAARVFTPLPQVLKNVRFGRNGKPPLEHAAVKA